MVVMCRERSLEQTPSLVDAEHGDQVRSNRSCIVAGAEETASTEVVVVRVFGHTRMTRGTKANHLHGTIWPPVAVENYAFENKVIKIVYLLRYQFGRMVCPAGNTTLGRYCGHKRRVISLISLCN